MEISTANGMPVTVEISLTESDDAESPSETSPEAESDATPQNTESEQSIWSDMTDGDMPEFMNRSADTGEESTSTPITEATTMTTLTSTPTAADFILEEVSPKFREVAAVTGANFVAGTVLSRDAAGDAYGAVDALHTDIAVLYAGVDASAADTNGLVIKRLAILKDNHLTWPDAFVDADITEVKTAMEAKHLITQ